MAELRALAATLHAEEAEEAGDAGAETAASAKEKDFSRIKENLRAAWTRTDDPDLLAVLGEACMNLTPWQYWNWTLPAPGPSTDEQYVEVRESKGARAQDAFAALTKALSADASHPLAAHALVHLTESLPIRNARFAGIEPGGDALSSDDGSDGSDGRVVKRDSTGTYPRASLNPSLRSGKDALRDVAASPRLGEAAADALFASFAKKSPKNTTRAGVSPHLAHMAAHTYARVGRFRSAVDASLAATRAALGRVAEPRPRAGGAPRAGTPAAGIAAFHVHARRRVRARGVRARAADRGRRGEGKREGERGSATGGVQSRGRRHAPRHPLGAG